MFALIVRSTCRNESWAQYAVLACGSRRMRVPRVRYISPARAKRRVDFPQPTTPVQIVSLFAGILIVTSSSSGPLETPISAEEKVYSSSCSPLGGFSKVEDFFSFRVKLDPVFDVKADTVELFEISGQRRNS